MLYYRGISQDTVVHSMREALNLLEDSKIGPETQKYIDTIKTPDANGFNQIDQIAQAKTESELAATIKQSTAPYLFARAQEVLDYHHRKDTQNKGKETYENLCKWGAFSDCMTLEFNRYDAEFRKWLKKRILQRKFNDLRARLRSEPQDKLVKLSPFRMYGIVYSEQDIKALSDPNRQGNGKTFDDISKTLEPFSDLGDINMVAIGPIQSLKGQNEFGPLGIFFYGTKRAALAVAAAFPQKTVVNENGERILSPSSGPKTRFKP